MKRKGYTLLEIICVLAILLIICSLGVGSVKYYNRLKVDIDIKTALYELEDIMTFSKSYCLKEDINGKITLRRVDGILYAEFRSKEGFKKDCNLGGNLIIYKEGYEIVKNTEELKISKEGHLEAKTIRLMDVMENKYKITVRVGVDLILVQQE